MCVFQKFRGPNVEYKYKYKFECTGQGQCIDHSNLQREPKLPPDCAACCKDLQVCRFLWESDVAYAYRYAAMHGTKATGWYDFISAMQHMYRDGQHI